MKRGKLGICLFLAGFILALPIPGRAFPMNLTDRAGQVHIIKEKPGRVVCLIPSITEMLISFGQAGSIAGLTRQDLVLNPVLRKRNVGSYFQPDPKAIAMQNGIRTGRDIFQRLADRHLSLEALVKQFTSNMETLKLTAQLETLLSQPYYAAFIESALSISDARKKELIKHPMFWEDTCTAITIRISTKSAPPVPCTNPEVPKIMAKAFGAIISGIEARAKDQINRPGQTNK